MLDAKWVRDNPDTVKAAGRRKRMQVDDVVDEFLRVDQELRAILPKVEGLRAEQKKAGADVAKAAAEAREALVARQRQVKEEIQALSELERDLKARRDALLLRLPNIPSPQVPANANGTGMMIASQRFRTMLPHRCEYDAKPGSKATTVPRRAHTLAATSEKAPTLAPTS